MEKWETVTASSVEEAESFGKGAIITQPTRTTAPPCPQPEGHPIAMEKWETVTASSVEEAESFGKGAIITQPTRTTAPPYPLPEGHPIRNVTAIFQDTTKPFAEWVASLNVPLQTKQAIFGAATGATLSVGYALASALIGGPKAHRGTTDISLLSWRLERLEDRRWWETGNPVRHIWAEFDGGSNTFIAAVYVVTADIFAMKPLVLITAWKPDRHRSILVSSLGLSSHTAHSLRHFRDIQIHKHRTPQHPYPPILMSPTAASQRTYYVPLSRGTASPLPSPSPTRLPSHTPQAPASTASHLPPIPASASFASSIQLALSTSNLRTSSVKRLLDDEAVGLVQAGTVKDTHGSMSWPRVGAGEARNRSTGVGSRSRSTVDVNMSVEVDGVVVDDGAEDEGKGPDQKGPASVSGIALIAAAAVVFSVMAAAYVCLYRLFPDIPSPIKSIPLSDPTHPPPAFQTMFVRCSFSLLSSTLAILLSHPAGGFFPREVRPLLVLRGLFSSVSTVCYYYALGQLKLSDAVVMAHTNPIWTGLLAVYFLGERWGVLEATVTLVCLFGVLLIAKPSFLLALLPTFTGTGSTPQPVPQSDDTPTDMSFPSASAAAAAAAASFSTTATPPLSSPPLLPVLAALGSAFVGSCAGICVRKVGLRASPIQLLFAFSLFTTLASLASLAALPDQPWVLPRRWETVALYAVVAVCGVVGQTLSTMGLQREKAARASTIGYTQIVYSFVWGWLLWGEVPDWFTVTGSVVVVAGVVVLTTAKHKDAGGAGKVAGAGLKSDTKKVDGAEYVALETRR
ncbi:hypothetical protein HDU93_001557 [Gonapodya sp. JEL0774]|nr:hypothetical protein HDU93_001557 [Gonapodya sp. JEL0774]